MSFFFSLLFLLHCLENIRNKGVVDSCLPCDPLDIDGTQSALNVATVFGEISIGGALVDFVI